MLAGHIFRWSAQLGQIYPQHNLSDEVTKMRCEFTFSDEVPRSAVRYTPTHKLSDEVIKITYE